MFQASIHVANDEIFITTGCCEDKGYLMMSTNVILINNNIILTHLVKLVDATEQVVVK